MNRVLLDIATSAMLDSCLVAAQAIVLNRLGIPFAAITAFSGIGAYAVALALNGSLAVLPLALLLSIIMVMGFSFLARPLPQDQYLLLTLAILGVLRATAGSSSGLGGQLGMTAASTLLRPQESGRFAVAATVLFAISLLVHTLLRDSEFGLAVSVARITRTDITARAFAPVTQLTLACFMIACSIASAAGVLKAMYAGRVDPDQFRVRTAIILLMPTLLAGTSPLRIAFLSIFFFAFPDLFGLFFGYNATALAFLREMAWSALIIALVSRRLILQPNVRPAVSITGEVKG